MSDETLRGYLVVKVLEAAGHNSADVKVWDDTLKDAFVKVEIRGGSSTVKKQTSLQKVHDHIVNWDEQLAVEHFEGATELRILLCRQKTPGERAGSSIIAACGIYMKDILEAVPIDKYFELFKPGEGAEGGFIRVSMNYLKPDQVRNVNGLVTVGKKKGGFPWILSVAVLAGVAFGAYKAMENQNDSANDKKNDKKPKVSLWGKK